MLRLLLVAFAAIALHGAERWVEFRSGPFEVYSSAGERAGRERLNELEQLRFALEQALGKTELTPIWPVRVLVYNAATEAESLPRFARDAYYAAVAPKGPIPRQLLGACAELLIQSGSGRLPDDMEKALADLFSTLDASGRQVLLGAPPPPTERTREWARMHMLAVTEPYYGKLRTLVYNLERGTEADPAYRNAVGKSAAEVDKEVEAYFRQGVFTTTQVKRKPIDPELDFEPKPVEAARAQILWPDLLLSDPARREQADAAYREFLKAAPASTEALEGLAMAALLQNRTGEIRELFGQAVAAASTNANVYLEYGTHEPDRDKAVAALEKAAKLNPRWGRPHFEMARKETDAALRAQLLAAAVKREPRRLDYWRALAEAQEAAGQFVDAAKSWASAEVAAGTPAEKQQIRRIRAQADERRREQEAVARDRQAAEARREIEALKQKSVASIQAAIEQANRERPPVAPSSGKIEPWWNGPRAEGKAHGMLRQVDCLGKQARLVVEGDNRQVTRLLIRDPSEVAFTGGGERSFACGVQKPARRVVIEYYVKPDAKLGTAGEAAVIEFP